MRDEIKMIHACCPGCGHELLRGTQSTSETVCPSCGRTIVIHMTKYKLNMYIKTEDTEYDNKVKVANG